MGVNERQQDPRERREDVVPSASVAVEVHIEELLLRGFNLCDRYAISDAAEHELKRLIVKGGFPGIAAGTMIERLDGGRFKVALGMKPAAVGKQLAQTLYRGMAPVLSKGRGAGSNQGSGRTK